MSHRSEGDSRHAKLWRLPYPRGIHRMMGVVQRRRPRISPISKAAHLMPDRRLYAPRHNFGESPPAIAAPVSASAPRADLQHSAMLVETHVLGTRL